MPDAEGAETYLAFTLFIPVGIRDHLTCLLVPNPHDSLTLLEVTPRVHDGFAPGWFKDGHVHLGRAHCHISVLDCAPQPLSTP